MSKPRKLYTRTVYLFFAFLAFVTRGNKHCVHKKLLYGALILGVGGQFGCGQKSSKDSSFFKSEALDSPSINIAKIDPNKKENYVSILPYKSNINVFTTIGSCYDTIIDNIPFDFSYPVPKLKNDNEISETTDSIIDEPHTFTCYTIVESIPEFPGGDEARIEFLNKNLIYPDSARKHKIQGTVFVAFIIETDGEVSNLEILRGIGYGCDEEAIRVIKLMPKWKPSFQQSNVVRVRMNQPIKFTLSDSTQTR
jgi:TonB family protein